VRRPRAIDIEQQIAQLRWRRQQNERQIRSALETTKILKQKDTILGITVDYSAEKSVWTNAIVRDELSRPLIVSDEELHRIEADDAKVKRRLLKYSHQQLDNVNKMIKEKEQRECKTLQGEQIPLQQLEYLNQAKDKLQQNLLDISNRKPYIQVKMAVEKLF